MKATLRQAAFYIERDGFKIESVASDGATTFVGQALGFPIRFTVQVADLAALRDERDAVWEMLRSRPS